MSANTQLSARRPKGKVPITLPHQAYAASMPVLLLQRLLALCLFYGIAVSLQDFPVAQLPIAFGLGFYLLVLWRWPTAWLLVLPGLLPVLDLTPWSGRTYFSEFDFLVLTTVAFSLLRPEGWLSALGISRRGWCLVLLLIVWQSCTTYRGLFPLQLIDGNSFNSFYSSYNSLRMAKGFFWALLLLPSLGQAIARQQLSSDSDALGRLITIGMLCSLASGLLALLWERALFTGLFNLDTPYRATGLFSGIATGGASVDAHLLMTLPFTLLIFVLWSRQVVHFAGLVLLTLALYATAITFSRANYPALMLGLATAVGADLWLARDSLKTLRHVYGHQRSHKRLWGGLVLLLMVTVPLLSGNYIQQRFSSVSTDLQTRLDHWQGALNIMPDDISVRVLGVGKGRFPNRYFWSRPDAKVAATVTHASESGQSFARFSPSDDSGDLFLRQRFSVIEPGPYRLKISLRPTQERSMRLLLEVCERLIFEVYRECGWLGINSHDDPSRWETYYKPVEVAELGKEYWYGSRPIDLAILNRGIRDGIEIGHVELVTPSGKQLLSNSDFTEGFDHWLLYSGDHLAWHIKNIWVDALFEGGWLGLSVFIALGIALAWVLIKKLNHGDWLVIPLAAAFVGAASVGLFDSLFDEPRIGLLFYLLVWIALTKHTGIFRPSGIESNG